MNKKINEKKIKWMFDMKRMYLLAATVALILSSCSSDNEIGDLSNQTKKNEIGFRTLIDKGANTRATVTNEGNILGFTVTGWWDKTTTGVPDYGNANVGGFLFNAFDITRRESGMSKWDYSPKIFWPSTGKGVYFFAYSPASSRNVLIDEISDPKKAGLHGYTGDDIYYKVPVPSVEVGKEDGQEDFLLARTGKKTENPVLLNFAHSLSRATFSANKSAAAGVTYLIKKVELMGVYNEGHISLEDIPVNGDFGYTSKTPGKNVLWTAQGNTVKMALDMGESPVYVREDGYQSILGLTSALMVLPQTVPDACVIRVYYKAFIDINDEGTYYAGTKNASTSIPNTDPADLGDIETYKKVDFSLKDFTFEIGRQYNFYLAFGSEAAGAVSFAVNVGNWDDNPPASVDLPKDDYWFSGKISATLAAKANPNYLSQGVSKEQIEAVTSIGIEMNSDSDLKGLKYFTKASSLTIRTMVDGLNIIIPEELKLGRIYIYAENDDTPLINKLDISTQNGSIQKLVWYYTSKYKDASGKDCFRRMTINELYLWSGYTYSYANFNEKILYTDDWSWHSSGDYKFPTYSVNKIFAGSVELIGDIGTDGKNKTYPVVGSGNSNDATTYPQGQQ